MDRAGAGCSGSVSADPHGAQPRRRGHGRPGGSDAPATTV